MISLFNDKVEGPLLARILLMQAGVKPASGLSSVARKCS